MASVIFPDGDIFFTTRFVWKHELGVFRGNGLKTVIAKGNIIEGIEAEK